jgi:hypothetical protein
MMPLDELDDEQDEQCLIMGGWVPNRTLSDLSVFDSKNFKIIKNPRKKFQSTFLPNSSDCHISTQGSDELGQADND